MRVEVIGPKEMADTKELRRRLAQLRDSRGRRVDIEILYRSTAPAWLTLAARSVVAVNLRGVVLDDSLIVLRLMDLERLLAQPVQQPLRRK
jgi:hypothetical protein